MSEPKMEVLRGVSASIPMPTKIRIGDPLYFEAYKNEPKKLERLTYAKNFRRPSWLGRVNLMEGLVHCATLNGEIDTFFDYHRVTFQKDEQGHLQVEEEIKK